jgi:exodeoxyribonuclease VII large subunit
MDEYSVSQFIERINESLGAISARVIGEVSELKMAASGHAYFTLKDKDTGFILPCTIWARDYALAGVQLERGMEIAAVGRANFYGPFGKLSFNTKSIELVGEGALKKAYELLKKKLTAEGLFAPEKKRPLPAFVRTIGVITSVHGAVIHDFSSNLGRYGFKVRILNSKVEGPESGRELALSVRAMRSVEIDILVIIRGGGSIQSLAGFDNEALVREITTFPVPVLAGVGHHQDVTLAALASDFAESTPSFVAALLNRSWIEAEASLARSEQRIKAGLDRIIRKAESAKGTLERAVVQMEYQFKRTRESMEGSFKSIRSSLTAALEGARKSLETAGKLISNNDPERQLRLGYSIVYHKGTIIRSKKSATPGSMLELRVSDGTIAAEVLED